MVVSKTWGFVSTLNETLSMTSCTPLENPALSLMTTKESRTSMRVTLKFPLTSFNPILDLFHVNY